LNSEGVARGGHPKASLTRRVLYNQKSAGPSLGKRNIEKKKEREKKDFKKKNSTKEKIAFFLVKKGIFHKKEG